MQMHLSWNVMFSIRKYLIPARITQLNLSLIFMSRTAVVVVATGVGMPNEKKYIDIGTYILEHYVNQLTEESYEINIIHHPKNRL